MQKTHIGGGKKKTGRKNATGQITETESRRRGYQKDDKNITNRQGGENTK